MPIRVNLKEIFPADSQESTVDKVNFNFNKLLELGIGDTGPIGPAGPEGSAGPVGLTGMQGLRGNLWLVDTGSPQTHIFNDLLDGDFYLDSNSFAVWQYSEDTSTWTEIVDFESIINYYISASPSPFSRAVNTVESPTYDRFITFNRRGNTNNDVLSDTSRGQFNTSENDVLFLTNYNELLLPTSISNFPTNSGELYNALLKISVNHSEGSSEQTGRYHLELGSLYLDDISSPSNVKMSELKHNLKAKFIKTNVSSTTPIPDTNTWINIAQFSMSVPEPDPIINIDENGIFEWVAPKYNNEVGTENKSEVTMMFGSEEGLTEFSANAILGDGLDISTLTDSLSIGIKYNLEDTLTLPYLAGNANFALFNVSDSLDGFLFNDKLIQTGGNIEQIHTYPAKYETKYNELDATLINLNKRLPSIYSNGKYIIHTAPSALAYTSSSSITAGAFSIYSSPDSLKLLSTTVTNSIYTATVTDRSGTNPILPLYDNHGHQTNLEYTNIPATNISDTMLSGKYVYFTRIKPQNYLVSQDEARILQTFIIAELDSNGYGMRPVGYFGPTTQAASDNRYNNLRRVEVIGSTAYLLSKKESTANWTCSASGLISLDVTSPNSITELNILDAPTSDRFLDFAIYRERAFIASFNESSPTQLELKRVDISDPSNLTFGASTTIVTSSPTESPARVKIQNDVLYLVYENKLFIYSLNSENSQPLTLISSTIINLNHTLCDIIINDNYAYILGENNITNYGSVFIYNITNNSAPSLISTLSDEKLTAPNRMILQGSKLFITTSHGTGPLSTIDGGIVELSIEGIKSPAANISNIRTNALHVNSNVNIGESLNVGHSLSIGSGGIHIDGGNGISSEGPIKISKSNPYEYVGQFYPNVNLLDISVKHDSQVKHSSGTSAINFNNQLLERGEYDSKIIGTQFTAEFRADTNDTVTGVDVLINSNLSQNAYGFKFNRTLGSTPSNKKVYGTYIENATENYLEGKLTIDGPANHTESTSVPAIASQVSNVNQFASGFVNTSTYSYLWTRVGNVVTCTGSSTAINIDIPIGNIKISTTNAIYGTGSWTGSTATIRAKYVSTPTQVTLVHTQAEATDITSGTKYYTFSYLIS
jgi:hypothetical protein